MTQTQNTRNSDIPQRDTLATANRESQFRPSKKGRACDIRTRVGSATVRKRVAVVTATAAASAVVAAVLAAAAVALA